MSKVTQNFNAEIKQLLDLMIHSLYSHKEIFLRELISNASDAIDKLKFQSLTEPELTPTGHENEIRLEVNKEQNTLKIIDTGIGMSQDEVIEYIGTIAKSGTKKFVQLNEELKKRPEMIGQFGVGFYSAFMVADKVTLHTQRAGGSPAVLWESTGDGTYSLDQVPRPGGIGTTITLHLKKVDEEENSQDFTEPWVLKSLIKKYSDFISYPIKFKTDKEDETLNSQKALWLKSSSEISEEEYKEFYKHLTHDWNEPLKHIHYKAEGTLEFTSLMYIPSQKPWNFYTKDLEYGLNLYVKKVFIMADCKDLLPSYLRFVKGLVDSSDLSLNVSREILQQDRHVTQIRKNITLKVLSTLKEMLQKDRTSYENFWSQFGSTLKEGIPSEPAQKEKIQDLILFHTSNSDKMTTLEEYTQRMKAEQKNIYFITGDNLAQVSNSPYLEKLKEKNFEVLFMIDPVDEWVTQGLTEYKSHKLQSITSEGLDLDSEEEKKQKEQIKKSHEEKYKPLIENLKKSLETLVQDVVISDRLTQTPVCLVNSNQGPSAHMQKLMSQMGQGMPIENKRILEINADHPLFEKMLRLNPDQQKQWGEILFSQALLTEGSTLPDPVKFSRQVAELMMAASST